MTSPRFLTLQNNEVVKYLILDLLSKLNREDICLFILVIILLVSLDSKVASWLVIAMTDETINALPTPCPETSPNAI